MSLPTNLVKLSDQLKELNAVPPEVNRIAVDELKHSYDILSKNIDKMQTKLLAFLAGAFGLLTFLYNGGDLFIPPQIYGRIFYFFGLAFVLTALIVFLLSLQPVTYLLPTTIEKLKNIKEKSEKEYLEYVKSEYIDSFEHNRTIYEKIHTKLHKGFVFLAVGATILVIIKTFPDNAKTCYTTNVTACSMTDNKGAIR